MPKLETVMVVNENARDGFMIINASDFDADVHEAFGGSGQSGEITRETIDKMKKPDVKEYLAAHGLSDADGSVAELREELKRIMFMDA